MQSHKTFAITAALSIACAATAQNPFIPAVFSAAGANAQSIQGTLDAYRAVLGTLNPPTPGSRGAGRREINWDGAPDGVSAPNAFPGDFFNGPSSPRARGAEFTTPGTGFQLSATAASGVGIDFSNLRAGFDQVFAAFSPQRLFTPLGSTITDVGFFVPGTDVAGTSRGFGAIFSDVNRVGSTTIEAYDATGRSLGIWSAPVGPGVESFSFLGFVFDVPIVATVRIRSGDIPVDGGGFGADLVVMDDFIYGEPVEAGSVVPVQNAGGCGLGGRIGIDGPFSVGNQGFGITVSGADPNATLVYQLLDPSLAWPIQYCGSACGGVILPLVATSATLSGGAGRVALALPSDPALAGFRMNAQWAVFSSLSTGCAVLPTLQLSNAVQLTLGL